MAKQAQVAIRSLLTKAGDVTTASWWNSFARKRQDVWGIADLEFIHPEIRGVVYVQCTTLGGISSHKKKILESEFSARLLHSGNNIWLIGYGNRQFSYYELLSRTRFEKHQTLGSLIRAARLINK